MTLAAGRDPRPDRAERRRQDHLRQPADRHRDVRMRRRMRLGDVPITGLGAHQIAARGLVRTFQVARVFGNLSVRENLLVPYLRGRAAPGGDRATGIARAGELLALSHAGAAGATTCAKSLSGGQRMLLQACAGFMIPACTAPRPRRAVRRHQSGGQGHADRPDPAREHERTARAFLIVSHEMEIIRRLCPRVTVMIAGPRRRRRHARRGRAAPGGDHRLSRTRRGMSVAARWRSADVQCRLCARRRHPVAGCRIAARANAITLVIGPNGAGKSTLLRTIFGIPRRRARAASRFAART